MNTQSLRILVPLDGSAEAETILSALTPLALMDELSLTLFGVASPDTPGGPWETYLGRTAERLRESGFDVDTKIQWGDAVREILWMGREYRYDLIAMATHGRSGLRRALVGSVCEGVLRRSDLPLLIARPGIRSAPWKQIVVALDGSSAAETVLPDATRIAGALKSTLTLVRAVPPPLAVEGFQRAPSVPPEEDPKPYLRSLCTWLATQGIPAVPEPREGNAADEVLGLAESVRAGLVCMTTHGRTGLSRALLGSVAESVLRRAPCPTLIRRLVPVEAVQAPLGT